MNTKGNLKLCVYLTVMVLWLVVSAGSASAHKAVIFAWVEGDTVFTQSKFSGSRKAQNSTVVVYDRQGNQLLEGKTDRNGEFSFKIPQKTELKVALKASMGHAAEWIISVEEIVSGSAPDETSVNVSQQATNVDAEKIPEDASGFRFENRETLPATVTFDQQALQQMIDKSLDKKLAPITKMLAKSMDREPGIVEILGGVGYILGLVGIALYVANRRRND